jgi:hypothetical protein
LPLVTLRDVRLVPVVAGCLCLVACTGPGTYRPPTTVDNGDTSHSTFTPDDLYKPAYNRADLDKALASEHAKETSLAQQVASAEAGSDDSLRVVLGDLAVRRRFIASLEACEANGRDCPPRLDEPAWSFAPDSDAKPPLDATLRFDLQDWIKISTELHARACACRTVACLDSFDALIAQLETQPTLDVQRDETAAQSIVWARECLFRLRGKKSGAQRPAEP